MHVARAKLELGVDRRIPADVATPAWLTGGCVARQTTDAEGRGYNRMLWTALKRKAAYLPG
jgi:hypothetical protein